MRRSKEAIGVSARRRFTCTAVHVECIGFPKTLAPIDQGSKSSHAVHDFEELQSPRRKILAGNRKYQIQLAELDRSTVHDLTGSGIHAVQPQELYSALSGLKQPDHTKYKVTYLPPASLP